MAWDQLIRRTDKDVQRARGMRRAYITLPETATVGEVMRALEQLTYATVGRAGGNGALRIGVREWERVKARRLLGMSEANKL